MIIINVNEGPKADIGLNGTNLKLSVPDVGELTVDLQSKQGDVQRNIDISLDRGFNRVAEGVGAWYVATIEVPPVDVEVYDTGDVDENGDPVLDQRELPLDTGKVKLHLWGLPRAISEKIEEQEGDA